MELKGTKVEYIDAARGIAILMVVICHAVQPYRHAIGRTWTDILIAGQYGVQLFFAASALTLCMAWDRDSRIGAFWVRRLFRIAPMYYLGILIYWALFAGRGEAGSYTLLNVAANASFVHGFVPAAHNSIVPGGWSIGTEVAFYAAFPFIVRPVIRLGRVSDWTIPALACGWSVLIGLAWRWTPENAEFRYHSVAMQLPVFLMGMWVYQRPALNWRQDLLGVLLVMVCWGATWKLHAINPLLLGLIAALALRVLRELRDVPAWLRRVGQASYSIYVLHFIPAFFVAPWLVSPTSGLAAALAICLTIGISYGVARLTEATIEQPLIRYGKRVTSA